MPCVLHRCKAVVGMDTSIVGARREETVNLSAGRRDGGGGLRSDRLGGFAADTSRQEQVPSDKSRRNRSCLRPRVTSHQPESSDRLMR